MLIGDPLDEGSTASSSDNELWSVENSFLRMRGNSPFFYIYIYICFFCPGLAGNVHLTSVRWSYSGYRGIRKE